MNKRKEPPPPPLDPDEVAQLTPEQKLAKVSYLEKEIRATKDDLKDKRVAAKDYISELEAQRAQLLEDVIPETREGSVQQSTAE